MTTATPGFPIPDQPTPTKRRWPDVRIGWLVAAAALAAATVFAISVIDTGSEPVADEKPAVLDNASAGSSGIEHGSITAIENRDVDATSAAQAMGPASADAHERRLLAAIEARSDLCRSSSASAHAIERCAAAATQPSP